jgi:2-dehydro-3-deoxyphosphogalactonate aldolase
MAELFNAQIAPHIYCGPIAHAAAAQVAFSCPNFLILETIQTDFHDAILQRPLAWEEGYIPAPGEPGLGIVLNETVLESHPYNSGGRLHLEMCQTALDSNNQKIITEIE